MKPNFVICFRFTFKQRIKHSDSSWRYQSPNCCSYRHARVWENRNMSDWEENERPATAAVAPDFWNRRGERGDSPPRERRDNFNKKPSSCVTMTVESASVGRVIGRYVCEIWTLSKMEANAKPNMLICSFPYRNSKWFPFYSSFFGTLLITRRLNTIFSVLVLIYVLGRGGAKIRELEERSGARIKASPHSYSTGMCD